MAGVGIDVADTGRFDRLLRGQAHRVWAHWFTEAEAEACRAHARPGEMAALRFAVKEATFKAVGAHFAREVRWRDIEVLDQGANWQVALHGEVAAAAADAGVGRLHVSTCRSTSWVIATVIAEASGAGARPSPHLGRSADVDLDRPVPQ